MSTNVYRIDDITKSAQISMLIHLPRPKPIYNPHFFPQVDT